MFLEARETLRFFNYLTLYEHREHNIKILAVKPATHTSSDAQLNMCE